MCGARHHEVRGRPEPSHGFGSLLAPRTGGKPPKQDKRLADTYVLRQALFLHQWLLLQRGVLEAQPDTTSAHSYLALFGAGADSVFCATETCAWLLDLSQWRVPNTRWETGRTVRKKLCRQVLPLLRLAITPQSTCPTNCHHNATYPTSLEQFCTC